MGRKALSKAVLGPSRADVPVVRKAEAAGRRRQARAEGVAGRATSSSSVPPDERRQKRYGQKVSFMDKYIDDDLFMVDEDGEPLFDDEGHPLKEDPVYAVAVPNRARHEKLPRLVWTEDDKLFVYREIQKCPINAKAAFVSAVLHRYGDPTSDDSRDTLILANSMQVRDQMKDLVKLRSNRDLPIVGNARFFLPSSDPRKAEFDEERAAAGEQKADMQEERQRYLAEIRANALKAKQQESKALKAKQQKSKKRKRKISDDEDSESEAEDDELEQDEENEPGPTENDEEQDELEIEKEIGDGGGQDETMSGGENEEAQPPAEPVEGAAPEQGVEDDAAEVEKEPSPEPAKRVVSTVSSNIVATHR